MVVELIGTPGAGKTSLLPAIIDCLGERGVTARTIVSAGRVYAERTRLGSLIARFAPPPLRGPLLWQLFCHLSRAYRFRFLFHHMEFARHLALGQAHRDASVKFRRHALRWYLRMLGQYEFLRTHLRPNEALVIDQGFVHRAVDLHASDRGEPDLAAVSAYLDLVPQPDLIIHVNAPLGVCEARVFDRGPWAHFRRESPAALSRFITNSHVVVGQVVERMRAKGWNLIEVDNGSEGLALSTARLRSILMNPDSASVPLSGGPSVLPTRCL